MTKVIPLNHGMAVLVNEEDFVELSQYRWYAAKGRHTFYAQRAMLVDGIKTTITMHKQILRPQPGQKVDHKDGDGLNNQRENIRIATSTQNRTNQVRLRSDNRSGYHGVSWYAETRSWRVRIGHHGFYSSFGLFKNPIDAAKAYDAAAQRLFGDFAHLNFPLTHLWHTAEGRS